MNAGNTTNPEYIMETSQKITNHLINFLTENPGARGHQLTNAMRGMVTANMMHPFLSSLQDTGLIHRKGNTSGARWYAGPDDINIRNEAILRLKSITADIRKTSILMNKTCEDQAKQLRTYAVYIDSLISILERMEPKK